MNPYVIICIVLGLALAVSLISNNKNQNSNNQEKQAEPKNMPKELPYSRKYLLTNVEYKFWNILNEKCREKNLLVCPKVRMEDFINVSVGDFKERQRYRGYIKSRHVDFLICDAKLVILAGVELDGSSHNNGNVQKTDTFKNEVFQTIKLPLFRIPTNPKIYEAEVDKMIATLVPDKGQEAGNGVFIY